MKVVAASLILLLVLAGCAAPGPLENGSWFLPYTGESNPFLIVLRSVANVGLAAVYVGSCAAYLLRGTSGSFSS